MNREKLRKRLDESLVKANAELWDLPEEYTKENWERQKKILARIKGLVETKILFATPKRELDAEEIEMKGMLF